MLVSWARNIYSHTLLRIHVMKPRCNWQERGRGMKPRRNWQERGRGMKPRHNWQERGRGMKPRHNCQERGRGMTIGFGVKRDGVNNQVCV